MILVGLTGTVSACGGGRTVTSGPHRLPASRTAKATPAPDSHVRILTPRAGQAVASVFSVRVLVTGFRLRPVKPNGKPRGGFGHLHFILDHGRYDQPRYSGTNGRLAARLGVNGYYSPAGGPQITYRGVSPGAHALQAQLVNNDESPTGVMSTVKFNVR